MANDLNQCNFIGRLGADVETRHLPSGEAVSTISLAVGWKTKDREGCEWVRVVAFGKTAENMANYLKKGSKIFVSGRLRTQKWTKDEVDHYRSEIVANQVQFLDGRQDGNDGGQGQPESAPPARSQTSASDYRNARNGAAPMPPMDDFDGSIPF